MSYMYDKNEFGKRLTELRKEQWKKYKDNQIFTINPYEKFACCKSQETLAEALGVERRTIGKWELGTSIPTIDKVDALCELLECNVDYLLGATELIGFSPAAIASHYSNIDINIINRAIADANYRDFLNYFMHPDNCSALINAATLTTRGDFLHSTELLELSEPLRSLVVDIFQNYQSITPINYCSKDSYKQFLYDYLPESKLSFSSRKLDERICVISCLDASKIKELDLSPQNKQSYKLFINYLVDYSFDILSKNERVTIQREHLGKAFVRMLEKYLTE